MTIRLLRIAEQELDDAILWHNCQAPGLGDAFLVEVLKALRLIERHPDAWHPFTTGTRRCRLSRFPYGIIYCVDGEDILVIAVAHLHRAPYFWRERLGKA